MFVIYLENEYAADTKASLQGELAKSECTISTVLGGSHTSST
jgi:hypothetical protein